MTSLSLLDSDCFKRHPFYPEIDIIHDSTVEVQSIKYSQMLREDDSGAGCSAKFGLKFKHGRPYETGGSTLIVKIGP